MMLYVDCDGDIDISKLGEEERVFVGQNVGILDFANAVTNEEKKILFIDKRENPCVTSILLYGEKYSDSVYPNHKYETPLFDIIWQPGSFLPPIVGYDTVITINPLFPENQ
jgi:hypothetical protein